MYAMQAVPWRQTFFSIPAQPYLQSFSFQACQMLKATQLRSKTPA